MENERFSCTEHVDILLEEYVNDYEVAPELDMVEDKIKAPCSWCGKDAVYCIIQNDAEETEE